MSRWRLKMPACILSSYDLPSKLSSFQFYEVLSSSDLSLDDINSALSSFCMSWHRSDETAQSLDLRKGYGLVLIEIICGEYYVSRKHSLLEPTPNDDSWKETANALVCGCNGWCAGLFHVIRFFSVEMYKWYAAKHTYEIHTWLNAHMYWKLLYNLVEVETYELGTLWVLL